MIETATFVAEFSSVHSALFAVVIEGTTSETDRFTRIALEKYISKTLFSVTSKMSNQMSMLVD